MKSLAGMSVLLLSVLIFVLLALAIYVFRAFPYILGFVLVAELLVLAVAILAPILSGARRGWFGKAFFALVAVALANCYMLFLAHRWNVEPAGWYHAVLHWQDLGVRIAILAFGFVAAFLDALLKAVFGLGQGPIGGFLARFRAPEAVDFSGIAPGVGGVSLAMIGNILVGVLGSLWSAQVVKRVLPHGSHGHGSAAHH